MGILPHLVKEKLDIVRKELIIRIAKSLCTAFIGLAYDFIFSACIHIGAAYNITELIAFAIKNRRLERTQPLLVTIPIERYQFGLLYRKYTPGVP